jgi:Ca2+-binding EF-hand superfamily protein
LQGYGGYPGGYPGQQQQVSPETQAIFSQVDKDRSGKINAQELQGALVNGKGQNFSDHCCALMISMFDMDKSGTIDVYEFEKLFNYINSWLNCFKAYDRDQSGSIEEPELSQALSQVSSQLEDRLKVAESRPPSRWASDSPRSSFNSSSPCREQTAQKSPSTSLSSSVSKSNDSPTPSASATLSSKEQSPSASKIFSESL